MSVNDAAKRIMRESKQEIVDAVKAAFPGVPFYEDEVPEHETAKFDGGAPYLLFILKMGAFRKQANERFLTQEFSLDYYIENSETVDENVLDIIERVTSVRTVQFVNSDRFRARHAKSERFVDIVSVDFVRRVKLEC